MSLTFAVPDSVLSTTLANYAPTMEEVIFQSNPIFYYLVGQYPDGSAQGERNDPMTPRGSKETKDGGESIVQPLMYGKNTTAGSYSDYDTLDVTPQEGITSARYNWKGLSVSVSISGMEGRKNNGKSQIINLLNTKISQAEMSLVDEVAAQMWGSGTDTTKDILGLQTLVDTTGTVGGIDSSTNTWWRSKKNAAVGSFASNGLASMRTMYNNASKGKIHPDFICGDQTTFERYEGVLQPQERFVDTKMADGGFENLKFKGAVYMYDELAPAGTQYFLNSKFIKWTVLAGADFTPTEFVKPANQDAKVAQILINAELNVSNRARLGVNSGITA